MVLAVVGGQFGSEAKGHVIGHLASRFLVHVRTGAPNAGHTVWHGGKEWKMRSVPCGWINPQATLIIGAGAVIDARLLEKEVHDLEAAGHDIYRRLWVDEKAILIDPAWHHATEGGVSGAAHQLIGSTGEGVGPARMAKIARGTFPSSNRWAQMERVKDNLDPRIQVADTVGMLADFIDEEVPILLEGTQGSGLSLTHGPWPYCTSADTNAAQLASDAGIPPQLVETLLVCRSYPIRVAGNSGPLPKETSWKTLQMENEHTTVTGKIRRVGEWDDEVVKRAIMLNRPKSIALMFADYVDPSCAGHIHEVGPAVLRWTEDLEKRLGVPVSLVGTGPRTIVDMGEEYGCGSLI